MQAGDNRDNASKQDLFMPNSPLDEEALFELVDEDPEFLENLVDTFLCDCATYVESIRTAINEDDAETLVREAHGLKGAAANMQAEAARNAARRLEKIGRSENLDRAPDALRELEDEIDHLVPALKEFVGEV